MTRTGEALIGIVAVLATLGLTVAAIDTGNANLFADVFGLGVMLWLVRGQYDVKSLVEKRPTKEEFEQQAAEHRTEIASLREGWTDAYDRVVDRVSTITAQSEDRLVTRAEDEAHRRHQLRKEFEDHKTLIDARIAAQGEKLAVLGAQVGHWPPRKGRTP